MDFLTSTILSGIAWDGIKEFGSIPGRYIKSRLTQWLVDDTTCEKIANKINDMPEEYKKSKRFLEVAIDENEELLSIIKSIQLVSSHMQNNSGSYNLDSNFVNGSANNTGNTYNNNYFGTIDDVEKRRKVSNNKDKEEYKILSDKVNSFLNCTSVSKLSGLWRRAAADSSDESSNSFLSDTARLVEIIEESYNNITTSILDIGEEALTNISKCRDESIGIINDINDLKMNAWQLTMQYKQELDLFFKGISKNQPLKEDIFRYIGYDVNNIKDKINNYSGTYWHLDNILKELLKDHRSKIKN